MKLLLLGATGLVGSKTLQLALANEAVATVIAPTRTPLAGREALINPVGPDLVELLPTLLSHRPDALICALGTTQAKAGSQQAFRDVDYQLPLTIAAAAHAAGIETIAVVTAMGASEHSRSFYYRTKGELERDLQKLQVRSITFCRPSLIGGERNETRRAEGAALMLLRVLAPILPRKLHFNPADAIATALLEAVLAAKPGCHWIYSEAMN